LQQQSFGKSIETEISLVTGQCLITTEKPDVLIRIRKENNMIIVFFMKKVSIAITNVLNELLKSKLFVHFIVLSIAWFDLFYRT